MSIPELIARKKYAKALELLREQFQRGSREPRLRLQLADVLVLAGRGREAIPILIGLADEHAREGFAAKAIAILKKIDKIDPGRADVSERLAALIQKERVRTVTPASTPPVLEIGIEEIGMSAPETEPLEPLMTEEDFHLELSQVTEAALAQTAGLPPAAGPAIASPLFSDFGEAELLAVMQGMRLLSFEPGDIIIAEGESGNSLFVLTTGVVKAFIRNPTGHNVFLREMKDGTFFGEISVLSGQPRTATVTAATSCELLELDRPTLDQIALNHPHVWTVLKDFYNQRAGSKDETLIRGGAAPEKTQN